MARIRIKNGPHKGAQFEIADGSDSLVMGRDEIEDGIQILDQGVSRRHAEIFRMGEMYFIRDLNSRNGTYVNEEKVTEELLVVGDEVKIGSTLMVFEDKRPKPSKEITPSGGRTSKSKDTLAATTIIRIADTTTDDEDDVLLDPSQKTHESRDLQVLYKVAKTVSSERDMRELSRKVIALSAEAIGADHGYTFVRHPERGEITLFGAFEREGKKAPVVSKNIIRRVLKLGRAIMTSDASTDDRFRDHGSVVMKQIRAVICAPLVSTEKLCGVLYLSTSKLAEAFTAEDLELVTAIGIQAGMAIQGLSNQLSQEKNYLDLVAALVAAIEVRDPQARGHSERVATYAAGIAEALGLSAARNRNIQLAALLHNIGGLFLDEREHGNDDPGLLKKRTDLAGRFFEQIKGMDFLLPAVKHLYEHWDGTGIPDGLSAEDIPLEARIISLAKDFDHAATAAEAARDTISAIDIIERLAQDEGKHDPRVLDALERAHAEGLLYNPTERVKV